MNVLFSSPLLIGMKMITLKCEECGISFLRRTPDYNRSVKLNQKLFCSLKCNSNYKNRVYRGKWGNGITVVTCEECKQKFERRTAEYNRSERNHKPQFCSLACSSTHRNNSLSEEQRKEWSKRMRDYNHTHHHGRKNDEYSPFREYMRRITSKERQESYGTSDFDCKYLKEIWDKQDGICPYTRIKMLLPKNTVACNTVRSPKMASLDRIDSSKGYIKGNVEFVCGSVNLAKNSFTREEMKEFFSQIDLSVTQP